MPHFSDHDFPVPGHLIQPDGYQFIVNKDTDKTKLDKLGRLVYKQPATGPVWIFNRSAKYAPSSIQQHVNDQRNIFCSQPQLKKPVIVMLIDGGPN